MLSPETEHFVPYLKYTHGLFNILVILFFLYQGWLGLQIRQGRIAGVPPVVKLIRRHRKFGPGLAMLGIFGFFSGISTVYFSEREIFIHPVHFLNGLTICAFIIIAFLISRKIRVSEAGIRNAHYFIGLVILALYFFQAYLGISMIF